VPHRRPIESLGKKKDSFRNLVISLISGKLPTAVIRYLTRHHAFDELRTAIEREVTILEYGLESHEVTSQSTLT